MHVRCAGTEARVCWLRTEKRNEPGWSGRNAPRPSSESANWRVRAAMLEGIIPRNFPKPERGYTLRSRALALAPLPMALVCFLLLGIQADFASGWTERTQHSLPIFAPWKLADDPSHPGRVYAVGTEYPGMGYWTVSDDEGMTWAAPRFIDSHPPVGAPLRMSVLPDGVILVAYISGARSDDEGATWTSISPPRPTLPVPDLPAGT